MDEADDGALEGGGFLPDEPAEAKAEAPSG